MKTLMTLESAQGLSTAIAYDLTTSVNELVLANKVDCYIVSTEDGFSPLGVAKGFIAKELGIDVADIGRLADWNRFENNEVSLVGLKSKTPTSSLRGVILAASETSQCYEQFAPAFHSKPYRDFYYNVAYESIAYAVHTLGARKLAMSHLSGRGHFHGDIATCVVEALAHFCAQVDNPPIESFLFVGCCINESHFSGIQRLDLQRITAKHRDIALSNSLKDGFDVVSLRWLNFTTHTIEK